MIRQHLKAVEWELAIHKILRAYDIVIDSNPGINSKSRIKICIYSRLTKNKIVDIKQRLLYIIEKEA
jgi:hypothetical protein